MTAPKGNKFATGHGKGAPEKYTSSWIEQEAEAFLKWMELPESIFFKSFAISRGYHPNRLQEFASSNKVFSGVLEIAKAWQESKLVNYGLFNKTNCGMTKFVLANHHGYAEKNQVAVDKVPLVEALANIDRVVDQLKRESPGTTCN
jgi:hypothetical protein